MIENLSKHKILFIVCIIVDFLFVGTAKLLHPAFSGYELIAGFYELGCILVFAFLLYAGKISLHIKSVLKLSCLMIMGVAAYSTLTYGQANIHADTAIATLLARAEIAHHSLTPRTWCYANGDIWLLDTQLAVMPFTLLMRNQVLARMLGSLVMMVIGMVSIYFLDKLVLKSDSYLISLPVLYVFIFGGYRELMWGNDLINYQAAYTCWLFFIPIMCMLSYIVFVKGDMTWKLYCIYFLLAVVCFARGVRAIAELMIPLALAYLLYLLMQYKMGVIKQYKRYLLFIAPMLLGCVVYKLLCNTHIVNTSVTSGLTFTDSLDGVMENAKVVFTNLFNVFGYNEGKDLTSLGGLSNMVSIICCVLFVFLLPYLQIRSYNDEPDGVRFFVSFALVHNIEMVISTIFFDKASPSHIFTFVIVSIMLSSIYVMRHWVGSIEYGFIYSAAFILASLIMTAQLGIACRGWQGEVANKRATADIMIERGLGQCKGYGTFWNIYPLSIYSDLQLEVAAIGNSDIALALTPHLNLVDKDKYIPDDSRGSYILLNYNENQELGNELEAIFGECTDRFNIGENYIYVWGYDVCEKF